MKFSLLKQLVTDHARERKESAGFSGAWDDGGSQSILNKMDSYQQRIVIEMDLRPSELSKLNDIEVGEPKEFSDIINNYKIKLAKNIRL
jgi:hypothetical protein